MTQSLRVLVVVGLLVLLAVFAAKLLAGHGVVFP